MGDSLSEIIYCSYETNPTAGSVDHRVTRIVAVARRNNETLRVTGALLYSDGRFAQVLEGPTETVERLLARIFSDRRHRDMFVLSNTVTTQRRFPYWAMALITADQDLDAARNVLDIAFAVRNRAAGLGLRDTLARSVADNCVWGDILPDTVSS